MKHQYTLQLHTGSYNYQKHTFEDIINKALPIIQKIPITDIILGWNTNKELNHQLIDFFHQHHIQVLLWLPVLSEIDQIAPATMISTITGTKGEHVQVIEHESFAFACPTHHSNYQHVIDIYEKYFSELDFDGVFIDKIRYPSFANGYEEGYECFCEKCQKEFHDIQFSQLKDDIMNHDLKLLKGHYDKYGLYHFDDKNIDTFYHQRSSFITHFIKKLSQYFSSHGLIVGADIYAPFLAYHVGQNTKDISEYVDFIKPMMYRYTYAPAGMKYEYEAYIQYFSNHEAFSKHWHGDPSSDQSIKKQLQFLSTMNTKVYPGIEINPIQNICLTNQNKLKQNLSLFHDYSTIALCWDLMKMDETFIDILKN